MNLRNVLEEALQAFDGVLGVSVKNFGTGEEADINGDELFPTASVFKVPVLIELFRQVENGELDLDRKVSLRDEDKVPGSGILKELSEGLQVSLEDLAHLMMVVSDNTATDLILKLVGKANVNQTVSELGLKETKIVASCREILFDLIGLDDLPEEEKTLERYQSTARPQEMSGSWSLGIENNDVTTPKEMTRILELILNSEAASEESCEKILDIMEKCQTGKYRIPKYLPSEKVEIAHKTGSLPGIRNDAGVVTIEDDEKYIISCFIKEAQDVYKAEEAIALTSKNVYTYFTS